jgi:hypothetical protein
MGRAMTLAQSSAHASAAASREQRRSEPMAKGVLRMPLWNEPSSDPGRSPRSCNGWQTAGTSWLMLFENAALATYGPKG